jgi:hypothetical protein
MEKRLTARIFHVVQRIPYMHDSLKNRSMIRREDVHPGLPLLLQASGFELSSSGQTYALTCAQIISGSFSLYPFPKWAGEEGIVVKTITLSTVQGVLRSRLVNDTHFPPDAVDPTQGGSLWLDPLVAIPFLHTLLLSDPTWRMKQGPERYQSI